MFKRVFIPLLIVSIIIMVASPVLAADKIIARPTTSTVLVNGQIVAFSAYNINDNNYFKLRDLAFVLNNTEKQFAVEWDADNNAILLTSGLAYFTVGGEMIGKSDGDKVALPTNSRIIINGAETQPAAYNIEGNNYFKLRDIGAAIDFGVQWDGASNKIIIDTNKRYESETSQAAKPADYTIQDDYKEGNGLSIYNKVCQIGQWIYFADFANIYRINVDGSGLAMLFDASLGPARGAGVHSLMQCGEYLIFSYGIYIYKMNLNTLKGEVLVKAEDQTTCFDFTTKDDTVYFFGVEGDFMEGIYKINVNGGQAERILTEIIHKNFYKIQIYDNQIYYSVQQDYLYRVNLDGSNKKQIIDLGLESSGIQFIVSGGYIYYLSNEYSLLRADANGGNITKFIDSCFWFIIRDDWIIYSELGLENNYNFGKNIYKMRVDKTGFEKIYDGGLNLVGSCGNWIYFLDKDNSNPDTSNKIFRIRLDGSGKMVME